MLKDILVAVRENVPAPIAAASTIAEEFEAHLTGVACAFQPVISDTTLMNAVRVNFVDQEIENNKAAAANAIGQFESSLPSSVVCDSFIIEGFVADCASEFGEAARRFDLTVLSQAGEKSPGQNVLIEAALFDSGRPVLMLPQEHSGKFTFNHIGVCWDGSRTAARALGDAMPLLHRAKKISVLTISREKPKSRELPAADIAQHLARHGLKVELVPISVEGGDVAQIALSYASDRSIDILVMGAFGHSRIREFVLGGMTRRMLQILSVPVFMSH